MTFPLFIPQCTVGAEHEEHQIPGLWSMVCPESAEFGRKSWAGARGRGFFMFVDDVILFWFLPGILTFVKRLD